MTSESLSSEEQYIYDVERGFINEALRGFDLEPSKRREMEYLAYQAFNAFRQPQRFVSVRMFKAADEFNRERLVVFMEEKDERAQVGKSVAEETAPLGFALRPEKFLDLYYCRDLGDNPEGVLMEDIYARYGSPVQPVKIWEFSPVI